MGTNKDPEVARWYAIAKHGEQKYGQQPYSYHLEQAVAELHEHVLTLPVLRFYDHNVIECAVWLHDVVEDTNTPTTELDELFCGPVVELVQAVTDGPGKNRKERKLHVYENIRASGPPAFAVKLADRLANAKAAGLAKGESEMLKMYRKEQSDFDWELRRHAPGFAAPFIKIREYLGME